MSDLTLDPDLLPATITPEFVANLSPETIAATLQAWATVISLYDLQRVCDFVADPDATRLMTSGLQIDRKGAALALTGPVAQGFTHLIAAAALGLLDDTGAENYVEQQVIPAEPVEQAAFDELNVTGTDGRRWALTVRPHFGETPGAQAYRYGAAIREFTRALAGAGDLPRLVQAEKALVAIAAEIDKRKASH